MVCALLLVGAACSGDDDDVNTSEAGTTTDGAAAADKTTTASTVAPAYAGYASEIYGDPTKWLCRGDVDDDVCDTDMDATEVSADGTTKVEHFEVAKDAPIDCFYVYPTISTDQTPSSDFEPGEDQELFVVRQQAARLGSKCRVFAPIYRQNTLTNLAARLAGTASTVDTGAIAYADVLDAWKHYMAHDNDGRGVVLIGHSQGAGLLADLIAAEIDPQPDMRARLVAAYILGATVHVAEGKDVGGDFANVPVCRAADQVGCVVAYSSFRAAKPPPANSFFAGPNATGPAVCANPAAPGGGPGMLQPYLPTNGRSLPSADAETPVVPWAGADAVPIETPFVLLPDFVEAECTETDGFVYLAVTVHGDPSDPRIDDIGGDITPEWGLHLVDVNVAMGDIVDLVGTQAEAYVSRG
jgi:hypothetical protein